jgi:phosphoenolpyruvate carboxylase
VELVLTAHPTEVNRRTLLQKHTHVVSLLQQHDLAGLLPESDRAINLAALKREVAAIWETDQIRRQKPTPQDEARSGFSVIESSLWDGVPRFLRGVDEACVRLLGRGLPLDAAPVTLASWMGGDRDGNPEVTAAVTREVCLLARWTAANLCVRTCAGGVGCVWGRIRVAFAELWLCGAGHGRR